MDVNRFDAFSRNLALATDRRTMVRGAAGGGFLAMAGMLLGRAPRASAEEETVTCSWEIEAHGSVGPNMSRGYNGILTIAVEPDGAIDDGTYVLVDGSWHPLVDSHGNEIAFDVVGSSHLRSIDFRVEHDGCEEFAFTGVNRHLVRECKGPMSGSFQGPELIDLGGWRTRRSGFCPPCRGTTCPPKTYLDSDRCECIPECPGTTIVCQDLVCVPEECPGGTFHHEDRCICACEPKTCKEHELWCPFVCECIPWKPCTKYDCPPGYVHSLIGEEICICVKDPCEKEIVCADGEVLVFNGEECRCAGDGCKEKKCDKGYVWDKVHCGCVKKCEKRDCDQGFTWDDGKCDCVPDSCPPVICPNGNYVVDEKTCGCYCVQQDCPGNYEWNADACECYCPDLTCAQGYEFNRDACDCVPGECAPQECGVREEWIPELCACVCAYQECATNYVWSYDACSCVCGLDGCDRGYTLDKAQCFCNPDNPCATAPPCADGLIQNQENCRCYCPNGGLICGVGCKEFHENCGSCGNRCDCCEGSCCIA